MGYDVHRLVDNRPLVLGGVNIPWEKGLLGHSDADVLLHAVCDALLGAAGSGDIGMHFPDTDPRYKGIDSLVLLSTVAGMLADKGYRIVNVDATLLAEQPRIAPYRLQMQKRIAGAIGIDDTRVQVKATTTEGIGAVGRQEGIAAMCVALLEKKMRGSYEDGPSPIAESGTRL